MTIINKAERYFDTGGFVFNEEQHIKLHDILCKINGKFILSYNDCDFVRKLYKDFHIESVKRMNNLSIADTEKTTYKELITRNF